MDEIDEELLEDLYGWVDQIPLSRPKRDIKRDFSDGVLVAEITKHHVPAIVELHNYAPANRIDGKTSNWKLLNRKAFKKLGFELGDDVIKSIVSCKPMAVEQLLMMLRRKLDIYLFEKTRTQERKNVSSNENVLNDRPESDQYKEPSTQNENVRGPAPQTYHQEPKKIGLAKSEGNMMRPPPAVQGDVKILLEEKLQESLAKEETIQILQAKVRRLEHLLHLKDIRIEDLTTRLESYRPTKSQKS